MRKEDALVQICYRLVVHLNFYVSPTFLPFDWDVHRGVAATAKQVEAVQACLKTTVLPTL